MTKRILWCLAFIAFLIAVAFLSHARAQAPLLTYLCFQTGATNCPNVTTANGLPVQIVSGGGSGGTASTFGAAFPATGTAMGVKNGANMVNLAADGSSNLLVNCAVGCSGGTFNNNADAVATSATNGTTAAYLYAFNGTTFDRLRVDGSKNLQVVLPANAGMNEAQINGVTPLMGNGVTGTGSQRVTIASDNTAFTVNAAQSGSWTATVTQGTGSNLHTQCDAGCLAASLPADTSAFTATSSLFGPVGGFFQTTATNNPLTTGQQGTFQVTANRALFTNLRNAAGTEIATAATPLQVSLANTAANGTAVSVSLAANQSVNLSQVNGVTTLTGAGATGTGAQRETVAQDATTIAGAPPGTAGTASTSVVTVQGIASMTKLLVTPDANSSVNETQLAGTAIDVNSGTKSAGTQRVVLATDQPALTNALLTNQQPTTSGGLSMFREIVPNNTTSVAIKASAGQLYSIDAYSISTATPLFIKFYNTAQAGVTCGTPTPTFGPFMIPASGGAPGSGFVMHDTNGYAFGTALTMCITAGIADNDTTAPAASTYVVNVGFK